MTDQHSVDAGHHVDHHSRLGLASPIPAWESATGPEGHGSGDSSADQSVPDDLPEGPAAGAGSSFGAGLDGSGAASAKPARSRSARSKSTSSKQTDTRATRASAPGDRADGSEDSDGEAKPARRKRRSRKKAASSGEAGPESTRSDEAARDEQPRDEQPRDEQPRDEQPRDGASAEIDEGTSRDDRAEIGEDDSDSPARKRRRRGSRGGRRRKRQDDEAAVAVDVIPGEDDDLDSGSDLARDDEPSREGPRKKKSRRKSKRSAVSEDDAEPEAADRDSADEGADSSDGAEEEGGPKKKRRRRRSRRKSGASEDDAAEHADDVADAADDDDDDEGRGRGSKKRAKRTRSKKKAGTVAATKTAEEKSAEAEALRTQTIAVNAVEPEERRVAVFEGDRILDFLMTAESQKTLVNDIYRGRVVNLEPAIGAAFIDFGQGRNGFLHTSDVLPIYGDSDFQIEDLLAGGHHDEEGDHDADWSEEADALDGDHDDEEDEDDVHDHDAGDEESPEDDGPEDSAEEAEQEGDAADDDDGEPDAPKGRRSLRSRSRRPASSMVASLDDGDEGGRGDGGGDSSDSGDDRKPARKARKRRPSRKAAGKGDGAADASEAPSSGDDEAAAERPAKRKRSRKKATARASDDGGDGGDGGDAESGGRKKSKRKSSKKPERKARSRKKASSKRKSKKAPSARSPRARGRSERRPQRERRPIDQLLRVGDSVVVQVTKDAIGDKGPTLTTYISMPGRYLVLMPSMSRTGVSRKIPDEKERKRLKRILASLKTPSNMGVIVRTAGVGRTKADLQRDLDYLLGLWEAFGKKLKGSRGPAPLYLESDVATRTLRDLFNRRTKEVLVDDFTVHDQMVGFAKQLMPEHVDRIKKHEGDRPLFQDCGIEQDFERIFSRRVDLPSGGSIVFDQAEALVAIDVNSGRTRTDSYDFEDIALKTNLEAVPEIARQIRLRDLGGIIVCDFIDMVRSSSNRQVERLLRDSLADDRARSKLGRISQFGLLELTRQRLGPGTHKKVFESCPRCRGTARIRSVESRSQAILRRLGGAVVQKGFTKVEVRAHPEVVQYLKEDLWDWVRALEHRSEKVIELTPVEDQTEDSVLRYLRADGREVRPGGRRKR